MSITINAYNPSSVTFCDKLEIRVSFLCSCDSKDHYTNVIGIYRCNINKFGVFSLLFNLNYVDFIRYMHALSDL